MTRGELTPYVHARGDTDHYQSGLALARNVIVLRYGGVTRVPGTLYRGPAKSNTKKARFLPFEFNRTQVYAIEAGDLYFRFWTPAGRIESPPGTPVEIASPYLEADLRYMQIRQSADVIYITCRGYQPRTLTRVSDTSWTLALYVPQDGPYLDINVTATTLTPADRGCVTPIMTSNVLPSGTVSTTSGSAGAWQAFDTDKTQTVTVATGSSGFLRYDFGAGQSRVVDAYWVTAPDSNSKYQDMPQQWQLRGSNNGADWTTLDARQNQTNFTGSETRFYEFDNVVAFRYYDLLCSGGGGDDANNTSLAELSMHQSAATQTPFNLTASSTVGINGGAGFVATDVGRSVRLLGSDGRWRWAEIAARTSATVVTIRLHDQALPDLSPIIAWRLGAWSTTTGWPSDVAIYEDRLTFARTDTDPLGVWASVSADYDNFRQSQPGVDDDGISVRLTGGKLNDIGWLSDGKDILAGTAGSLRAVGRNNPNTAFSPSNVRQRSETLTPSSRAVPVEIENVILFMDYYEQRLYEAAYTYEIEGYLAREVSTLNEHLFAAGVWKIVYLSHPNKLIIGLRYDGQLVAFAYDREQKVTGGTLIDIGGVVEDAEALSGATGTDLWMVVRRTINGATVRSVETLAEFWRNDFTVQDVPIYASCARVYDGAATHAVAGVTHLLNETVGVWADGHDVGDVVVSNAGVVTLPGDASYTASQIVIGKRMAWKVQTLRLTQIGNRDGSGMGRAVNIVNAKIDLYESAGISMRALDVDDANADLLGFEDEAEQDPDAPMTLRTGMFDLKVDDSWKNNGVLVMQGDRMYPVTIRAIQLQVDGEP
jgi:hypothetical protein